MGQSNILVDYQKPYFVIQFPFNHDDLQLVRNLPIRVWDRNRKAWLVHRLAVYSLGKLEHAKWSEKAIEARENVRQSIRSLVDAKLDRSPNVPENYGNLQLRNYQRVGSAFLRIARRALLADEMGLGKTIESVHAIVMEKAFPCLVLCPAALKWNWYNQIKKHFDMESRIVVGNASQRRELWQKSCDGFVIANYDLLRFDWDYIPRDWAAIIADEAVALKSEKAIRTRLARKLKSRYRIALTGMPLENNLLEFYSIMKWVRPEVVPSHAIHFKRRYCDSDWHGNIIRHKNLGELHLLTSPFILRRTKKDVMGEMPPKIYSDFPLDLTDKQQKCYRMLTREFIDWLATISDDKLESANPLTKVIRLRQFVEFPELVGMQIDENPRLDWLKDICASVDKVVVFTYFAESAKLLQRYLDTQFMICGGTPASDRWDIVNRFNGVPRGVLVSTDVGRFGFDITGADTLVHWGYFYNPATMLQREDRLHRIGQKSQVHVLRPFYHNTIDVGIRSIYMSREQQFITFVDGSDAMSHARLSRKEYERMVNGDFDDPSMRVQQ